MFLVALTAEKSDSVRFGYGGCGLDFWSGKSKPETFLSVASIISMFGTQH